MNVKIIITVAVVAVLVAGGITAAVLLSNNGKKDSGNDDPVDTANAKDLATDFCANYNGMYGTFTVSDGATKDTATITSSVKQYLNKPADAGMRTNSVKITLYESNEKAAEAYSALVTAVKDGTSVMCHVYDAVEVNDAKDFGCDKVVYKIGTRNVSDKSATGDKTYSVVSGAAVSGRYVVDFSAWKLEDAGVVNLYYGMPIESVYAAGSTVSKKIMESSLNNFTHVMFKSFGANVMTSNFAACYTGMFGTFSVSDGATKDTATVTSSVKQYINKPADAGMRTNSVKITQYETAEAAAAAYATLVTAVNNGTSVMCHVYDAVEVNDAKDFGCDKVVYKIGTRNVSDKSATGDKTYSVISGAALDGKYVIDFSAWKLEDAGVVNLYYGMPIESVYDPATTVTQDIMVDGVKEFLNLMTC
jgi:hypothetical protein